MRRLGACLHDQVSDVVVLDEVVAKVCDDCIEALPFNFGCQDCEWVEMPRRLCDSNLNVVFIQGRRCEVHS